MSVGCTRTSISPLGVGLDDAEELDRVAELFGEADVVGGDLLDALDENLVRRHPEAVGERGEDDGLVRGVPAIHIERGIGLGVAGGLGLGERLGEARARSRPCA